MVGGQPFDQRERRLQVRTKPADFARRFPAIDQFPVCLSIHVSSSLRASGGCDFLAHGFGRVV